MRSISSPARAKCCLSKANRHRAPVTLVCDSSGAPVKICRLVTFNDAQSSVGVFFVVPRIHFQIQLAELKDKLLAMAALAQLAVETAVEAYLQRDQGLCQYVKQNETAINSAQRELDEMAYELLAKEQPIAIDLRFILAVIKINGDLERIGDQSMSIAVRTRDVLKLSEVDLPVDFFAMGEYASRMIRTALQSLLDGDAQVADTVRE